jgi:hypothetical protein
MSNFRPINRGTSFLLPPLSVDEWLPEQHLARFVVEIVDQMDLSGMETAYRGSGSVSYQFDQCYNAQAAVAAGSIRIVANDVTQAPNDRGQIEPMVEQLAALPEELGEVQQLLADTGYMSAANVEACEQAGIEPMIAMGRGPPHGGLVERFAAAPPEPPAGASPVQSMPHRLKIPRRKEGVRAAQADPEPVFGIIKSVMGFRQFLLRGLRNVRGEWDLVTMAWSIQRMFVLQAA